MYRNHSIAVVVPAYNEEGHIGDVISSIPAYVDCIFLVDDASTDGTWDEALAAAREHTTRPVERQAGEGMTMVSDGGVDVLADRAEVFPREGKLVPIRHRENLGAGGAIKTGYLAANRGGYDITVTMDGDGQMDPDQMSKLLDPIVEGVADYAKGNRLLNRNYRREMPRFRLLGNSMLTFLTKIASGYWKTMDPQNGYTAISREALDSIDIPSIYEYYAYLNNILVRLNARGMRVADVSMPAKYGDETSSIHYPTYIRKVSGMLLRNFLWRVKTRYLVMDFHPLALFYLFGSVTAGVGFLGVLLSIYLAIANGTSLFVPTTVSLLLFAVGIVCILFGMVFDVQVNEGREVQIHE